MNMERGGSRNDLSVAEDVMLKRFKFSYTRDFLLSLSVSDKCKSLPSGFDKSLLSEFEDSHQERIRPQNSFSSQNYRRVEYGTSPPSRGDTSSYSRTNHGKWDSRSFSGKVDRESESQPDLESGRRPWQVREQDGLLGSGSFPRPLGYGAGSTVTKVRAGDNTLNRVTQPYHPPRPHKAISLSHRDNNDSYNDETFSFTEYTSEDRVEEERKRRASFEQMRNEQHKAFHEKQKTGKSNNIFDIDSLVEEKQDSCRPQLQSNPRDETLMQHVSSTDITKPGVSIVPAISRPAVPPGFSSAVVEKNSGTKVFCHSDPVEGPDEHEDSVLLAKDIRLIGNASSNIVENQAVENITFSDHQIKNTSVHELLDEKARVSAANIATSDEANASSREDTLSFGAHSSYVEPDSDSVISANSKAESQPAQSTSILDKLFNCLSFNESPNGKVLLDDAASVKQDECVTSEPLKKVNSQSSKFVQWFLEDEKKLSDSPLSNGSSDLLSLIAGNEQSSLLSFDSQARQAKDKIMALNHEVSGNPEMFPPVLTCEDLEHSILSEATVKSSSLPPSEIWSSPDSSTHHSNAVDNQASQLLLSLLQKGAEDSVVFPKLSTNGAFRATGDDSSCKVQNNGTQQGNPLTLESLFGSAFMKELKSGSLQDSDDKSTASAVEVAVPVSERVTIMQSHGSIGSLQKQNLHPLHEYMSEFGVKSDRLGSSENVIREDGIVYDGEIMQHHDLMHGRNMLKPEFQPPGDAISGMPGNGFPPNSAFIEERPLLGSHGASPFSHMQGREANILQSSHLPQPQLNSSGLFQLMNPHNPLPSVSSQMIFMPSDGPRAVQPLLNHPHSGPLGFEATHNPMFQHLQMSTTLPHLHMPRFPRGAPFSHPQTPIAGFGQDPYAMQGFPLSQGLPLNSSGNNVGLAPPRGPLEMAEVPNQHDALQMLIEMEHRAKQGNPQLRSWPQSRRVRS